MNTITIKYNGEYPNLCSGDLIVVVDGTEWQFPKYCLSSGGSAYIDDDYDEVIRHGEWSIREWPANFPEELKKPVLNAINKNISHGCCGGCI